MAGTAGVPFPREELENCGEPHTVPLYMATEKNMQHLGRVVQRFEEEEVWIETWPQPGWRPIVPGTGNQGGVHRCDFTMKWEDGVLTVHDSADDSKYHIGRHPDSEQELHSHVLVREAAYHPDGGQVLYPAHNTPFVLLLAPPGDDIQLKDFAAYYFDGSFGFQIKTNVWHLFPLIIEEEAVFLNKQGKVHAIIEVNTVKEFGKYLRVPMSPDLVTEH